METSRSAADANPAPAPSGATGTPATSCPSSQAKGETGVSNDWIGGSPDHQSTPPPSSATASQTHRTLQPSTRRLKSVPWLRPAFAVALGVTASSLALDVWLGNALWAWYSFVGILWISAAAWLDRALGWNIPDRILWWACLPLAMHYVGGSASGIHQIGGPNGLYWAFPWWDNIVHFLGAGAAAVIAAHALHRHVQGRLTRICTATAVATTLGVFVELYEFVGFAWFGTIDQGYYTNTMLDLYYNLLGAAAFAWAATGRRPSPVPRDF